MSEGRSFTENDVESLVQRGFLVHSYIFSQTELERLTMHLNDAFPEGLATPKPVMRTTPVTAEEVKNFLGPRTLWYQIVAEFFPTISAVKVAEIADLYNHTCLGTYEANLAHALNTVLGLVEPESPLVTIKEAQYYYDLAHNPYLSVEGFRNGLGDLVRAKTQPPEGAK